mgnify:CR=1 FL=1
MNGFDYYNNINIVSAIDKHCKYIHNHLDREDFRQEVFAELYDFMPGSESDSIKLVNKIASRFRKETNKIHNNEMSIELARGI